jgi:hypothetical protein
MMDGMLLIVTKLKNILITAINNDFRFHPHPNPLPSREREYLFISPTPQPSPSREREYVEIQSHLPVPVGANPHWMPAHASLAMTVGKRLRFFDKLRMTRYGFSR